MMDKKKNNSIKNSKNERKGKVGLQRELILKKNIKLNKDDKILEKVEKYVDKDREKTSQEIMKRKITRPVRQYQEGELELMISSVNLKSMPKQKIKKVSNRVLYLIYTIIFIVAAIFVIKYFYVGNMPQIS